MWSLRIHASTVLNAKPRCLPAPLLMQREQAARQQGASEETIQAEVSGGWGAGASILQLALQLPACFGTAPCGMQLCPSQLPKVYV